MSFGEGAWSLENTVSVLWGHMMLACLAAMVYVVSIVCMLFLEKVFGKCSNSIEMQNTIIKMHKE